MGGKVKRSKPKKSAFQFLLFFLGYDTCYESVGSRCHAGSHYLAHFVSLLWPDYFRLNPRKSNLCCFCRNVRLRKQPLRRVAEYSCRRTILSGTCQTKCNQTSQLNMVAHFGPNQKKKTIMIIYALFALSLGLFVTQLSIDHAWLVGNECKNKKKPHTHKKKTHNIKGRSHDHLLGRVAMSGFEYTFISDVSREYFCPICECVVREPVQTKCGHRFCKHCLEKSMKR